MQIPLNKLDIHPDNVRQSTKENVDDLMASIKSMGLFHPLIVLPDNDKKGHYLVITGRRRFLALKKLHSKKPATKVECVVRDEKDTVASEVSLAENIERLPMSPVEQFKAFAKLSNVYTVQEIADRFGVKPLMVKQRMALGDLHPKILKALEDETINTSEAMAYTLAKDPKHQYQVFLEIEKLPSWQQGAPAIRRLLTDNVFSSDIAIFDLKLYEGPMRYDLFSVDEDDLLGQPLAYLDDTDQAIKLQQNAFRELEDTFKSEGWSFVDAYREGLSSMDRFDTYRCEVPEEHYEDGEPVFHKYTKAERQETGVVLVYDPLTHKVDIMRGMVHRTASQKAAKQEEKADDTDPYDFKHTSAAFGQMQMQIRKHFFQDAIAANPRIAKELLIVDLMSGHFSCRPQDEKFMDDTLAQVKRTDVYKAADELRQAYRKKIGISTGLDIGAKASKLYQQVKKLKDKDLDQLLALVISRGLSIQPDDVRTDALTRMKVDLADQWRPDIEFLKKYSSKQLHGIMRLFMKNDDVDNIFKGANKHDTARNVQNFLSGVKEFSAQRYLSTVMTDAMVKKVTAWLPPMMK